MDLSVFSGKKSCCFTGHRPDGLPAPGSREDTLLRLKLCETVSAAASAGVTRFLDGGARGFDLMAAEAVLKVKESFPRLSLELELCSPRQAGNWPAADARLFERVLGAASSVRYAADTNYPFAYLTRDRALVDGADVCICYLRKASGGTMYTVNYALDKGIPILNLYGESR